MKFYRSGEWIPYSGVYRVLHHEHMHSHAVTCLSGETFPECLECRNQVRFLLLSAARSIKKHAMFGRDSNTAARGSHVPRALPGGNDLEPFRH
jgi:hypothetical protein